HTRCLSDWSSDVCSSDLTPALQARVREAHPEVTFAVLAGRGHGLEHAKKTPAGERERLAVLRPFVPAFDPGAVRQALGAHTVARDRKSTRLNSSHLGISY